MKRKYLEIILALALVGTVISGFAYTWTPVSPSYGVISLSADGRIVCACPSTSGRLRISRDWGQTWLPATNAPPSGSLTLNPVALSANGSQIIACLSSNSGSQTSVFLSTDFGTNWTKLGLPSLSGLNAYSVICSANGSNVIAASGHIYFSTNSGANWSTSSAPQTNWISLASSADGRRMVGAVNGGRIYFSTNFGADWAPAGLPVQSWKSVCVSADGKWVGASSDTNSYISSNSGGSWITNKINGGMACSANGSNWMVAGAQVYTSSDGGGTWITNLANAGWGGAMSADGCEIVVCQTLSFGGGLTNWVGRITSSPHLQVQAIADNLDISWLLPSTNFVLQQNGDFATTNWVTVSGSPVLNFTNLHYEMTVPNSGSNDFFPFDRPVEGQNAYFASVLFFARDSSVSLTLKSLSAF